MEVSFAKGFEKVANIKMFTKVVGARTFPLRGKDKILKRLSDIYESRKYTQKGLQDMLRNDIPASGRLAHERANMEFIANNLHIKTPEKFDKAVERIKNFLRANREPLHNKSL